MLDLENYGLGKAILFYCVVNSKDLSYSNHKILTASSWSGVLMARGERMETILGLEPVVLSKYQSLPEVSALQ